MIFSRWLSIFPSRSGLETASETGAAWESLGIERDFNNKVGIIYHDIPLREIDICHELLHIRYPETLFPYLNYNQYEEWIDRKSYKLLENEKV